MRRPALALMVGLATTLATALEGCSYLRYTSVQNRYQAQHEDSPRQWLAKHLLGKDTWFVYGRLLETPAIGSPESISVVALSDRYRPDEVVDVNRLGKATSYYGMSLPEGEYRLVVLADVNRNGTYEQAEAVGETRIVLNDDTHPHRVAGDLDIVLVAPHALPFPVPADLAVPVDVPAQESLFFPRGTIRSLDDPIFSDGMAQMGIYDPAAFMEAAPMMFYALEEDVGYKVPVIFVHGIGGSPRQFAPMVDRLDRRRFKPWFFYYPSGEDLNQLAQLFHDIFLSGTVIPDEGAPIVLIAHSMGGLVVREAMNLQGRKGPGNEVASFITLATPFGGDPAARMGVANAPLVPRSWRDLDPSGPFVAGLFRQPLPPSTARYLIYAYRDIDDVARGGDGVVTLSRQLPAPAVREARDKRGFKSEHTAVLSNADAIAAVLQLIDRVRSRLPEEQLRVLVSGGFDVPLGATYGTREKYAIRTYGAYLRALASGELKAVYPEQHHFVEVAAGRAGPENEFETAWLKFRSDYPELAGGDAH